MNSLLSLVLLAGTSLADEKVPEAEDVKAGWLAFGIFLLLIGATVVLCFSFVKQLRKAQAAKDAGAYGDEPVSEQPEEPLSEPASAPDDEVRGS